LLDGDDTLPQVRAEVVELMVEGIDLLLKRVHVPGHLLVFRRVLEAIAAVGRVDAVEVEIAAALAGRLAVAFDLATFALSRRVNVPSLHGQAIMVYLTSLHAMEM
jgi:hypothetical protein